MVLEAKNNKTRQAPKSPCSLILHLLPWRAHLQVAERRRKAPPPLRERKIKIYPALELLSSRWRLSTKPGYRNTLKLRIRGRNTAKAFALVANGSLSPSGARNQQERRLQWRMAGAWRMV